MSDKQNISDNIPYSLTSTSKYHEPKLYEPKYHDKPYRILHMQNEFWFSACDWLPALGYTNYKNYLKSIPTDLDVASILILSGIQFGQQLGPMKCLESFKQIKSQTRKHSSNV